VNVQRDDWQRRFVVRIVGPLNVADVESFVKTARTGAALEYGVLFDLREVTAMPAVEKVHALATLIGGLADTGPRRGRTALLADTDRVYRGAQLFEQWCRAIRVDTVRACRGMREAERWLSGDADS
jgi:hypothetical protein